MFVEVPFMTLLKSLTMPKKKEKVIMITDSLEPNSVYDSNRDTSCGNSVRSILMTKDNLKNLKNL